MLIKTRLILYFPVSALVTLFGNILQNPQDPRARSDVRLMNLVVGFLSMLNADEENGGVRRMLGVCSEFERIAKVVLDKAEKETSSRRKRKVPDDKTKSAPLNHHGPPQTPMMNNGHAHLPNNFSPAMNNPAFHKQSQNDFSPPSNASPQSNWQPELGNGSIGNGNEYMSPNGMTPFSDIQGYPNSSGVASPMGMGTFQQPFIPQDIYQMPMSLEWDWADLTGGAYPSFQNGIMGDMGMQDVNNDHLNRGMM